MELISYAVDFVSFLLQNIKDKNKINTIILFGSVARDESDKDSDIDIFINTKENIEGEVNKIKDKFYDSIKYKKYWVLLGIKNEINLIFGELEKWKLKDSMLGSAIVLYQHYSAKLSGGKNKAVLYWENIKPDVKRVMLNKRIYGYNHYGKKYLGLLEKNNGVKIGSNVIIINIEELSLFLKVFRKSKIPIKILRIFEYEK